MKRMLISGCLLLWGIGFAVAQDIAGDWQGTLSPMGDVELRLVLHITKNPDGTLKAHWTVWIRARTALR